MSSENINTTISVPRKKLENYKKVKKGFSNTKKVISIVGGIATVVLLFCPLDGPVGEIASLLATGGLYLGVDAIEKIYDNVMNTVINDLPMSDMLNNLFDIIWPLYLENTKRLNIIKNITPAVFKKFISQIKIK